MRHNEQRDIEPAVEEGAYELDELAAPETDPVVSLLERFRYVIVALLAVLALVSFSRSRIRSRPQKPTRQPSQR